MKNARTLTTMTSFIDGKTTYGVMVGPLVTPKTRPSYVNVHKGYLVTTVTVDRPFTQADYNALTAKYATPGAPAVEWQRQYGAEAVR